ncbi:MAG TPA: 3-hydroxyacyl-CoA dehydrogenase family protein [Cyclobacteriaceae bacterium]|nr:3-hydroxyacyl-CoA dehydrogenase family protein [Cyclobacteriaceae bacterium]
MNILVIGTENQFTELRNKFGEHFTYTRLSDQADAEQYLKTSNIVFDFLLDEDPYQFDVYRTYKNLVVFVNATKLCLAEIAYMFDHEIECELLGFNGLPGFVNRPLLEVSVLRESQHELLKSICDQLNTKYQLVADRVGMVSPRVICMIINEAYYTLQEGTASRADIDAGMKLGTAYPHGPFEWAQKLGIHHVYELLEAVYEDTKDERYKICPLLKREYLLLTQP